MTTGSKFPDDDGEVEYQPISQDCRKRKISDTVELPNTNNNGRKIQICRRSISILAAEVRKFESIAKIRAANLPYLNPDLIAEIFARLPVKPLLKFRCLSRYWDSLISSKQFVKTHLQTNTNYDVLSTSFLSNSNSVRSFTVIKKYSLPSFFYQQTTTYAANLYCNGINPNDYASIVGCVNGLCCVINESQSDDIFLWNPSTRKCKKLPSIMDCVGVENTIYILKLGFGLVDGSDDYDYKVLCVGSVRPRDKLLRHQRKIVAALYTLKTDSWRTVPNLKNIERFTKCTEFMCGKIYCLANHPYDILSFDLGTEAEGLVPQPSNVREGNFTPSLGKLGGSLCLFLDYPGNSKDVWVMKDYGMKESWVKVVTIPHVPLPWNSSYLGWKDFTPLSVSVEGVILFVCGSTFIIYNPKDKSFRYPKISNFPQLERLGDDPGEVVARVNLQSLVSIFPDL